MQITTSGNGHLRRGSSPSLLHVFARAVGTRCVGVKGVDRLLRTIHHPDRRRNSWIASVEQAYPEGPRYHLETRWFTEWQTYFYGSQSREIHRWICANVRSDWVACDVGANFGYYTCLLASRCAQVHAFEPVPWLAARLEANVALNRFQNVRVNRMALGDRDGAAQLNVPSRDDANWGTSSLVNAPPSSTGEKLDVPLARLDSYLRDHGPRIDFIKLDVEGAEHLFLQGGMSIIQAQKPYIITECKWASRNLVVQKLIEIGYSLWRLDGRRLDVTDERRWPDDILAVGR